MKRLVERATAVGPAVRFRARKLGLRLLVPVLWLSLRVIRLYRPDFHRTDPWVYRMAEKVGVYPVLDHYHEPLVSMRHLDAARAGQPRTLPGIDFRVDAQLKLLRELRYGEELEVLAAPRRDDVGGLAPTFDNLAFGPGDAEILYSLVRHLKPSRILEVGGGHSTRFAKAALDRNHADGHSAEHICIEPFESLWLEAMGVRVLRQPVEEIDPSVFSGLAPGDILFIDSSHVVRPQGDVLFLVHEVLPILPPGVLVHIHDIYTPRDYPIEWLRRRWLWTEQYLVEALLVNNSRLEIMLAANFLFEDHRADLDAACPVLARNPSKAPGSLWLQVT